jgi:hypothetical protein
MTTTTTINIFKVVKWCGDSTFRVFTSTPALFFVKPVSRIGLRTWLPGRSWAPKPTKDPRILLGMDDSALCLFQGVSPCLHMSGGSKIVYQHLPTLSGLATGDVEDLHILTHHLNRTGCLWHRRRKSDTPWHHGFRP